MTSEPSAMVERMRGGVGAGWRSRVALASTSTRDESEHGALELAVAVGVQHGVDGRVGVTENDGDDDEGRGNRCVQQRYGVHDVQRKPAHSEDADDDTEPLGGAPVLAERAQPSFVLQS